MILAGQAPLFKNVTKIKRVGGAGEAARWANAFVGMGSTSRHRQ